MARFNTALTITSASLFLHITSVGVAVPYAYLGIFDVAGCLGGKTLLHHGIAHYPASQEGAPSQWEGRTFAFAQDVSDPHGDILTIKLEKEHLFHVTDGVHTTTIPASIAARDALWDAAPIGATERILPVDANDDTKDGSTIKTKMRHLVYSPTKHIHLVIRERLTPRQLWDRLAHQIATKGDAISCQNLLEWATMIGFRDNTIVLPALVFPAGDADLFQHRRQVLYHQLPALQAKGPMANISKARVHHLLGKLVQEQRLSKGIALLQFELKTNFPTTVTACCVPPSIA